MTEEEIIRLRKEGKRAHLEFIIGDRLPNKELREYIWRFVLNNQDKLEELIVSEFIKHIGNIKIPLMDQEFLARIHAEGSNRFYKNEIKQATELNLYPKLRKNGET